MRLDPIVIVAYDPEWATSFDVECDRVQRALGDLLTRPVETASDGWRGWLTFRDYLRAHPDVAAEYATLKSDLAARHGANPDERDAYRGGKADFIVSVSKHARMG